VGSAKDDNPNLLFLLPNLASEKEESPDG